jgi:NAD(P)-dependent dehydrogenase (short-subunit alcohol dehydrogenase family)
VAWTTADIPDQTGRVALVTGATSGLGELTARVLASRGAHVLLATRSIERTEDTIARIRRDVPEASLEHVPLDLADLASVAGAADRVRRSHDRLDVLVANAGVLATPLQRTADGFEWQLGVNHLGHQALIADLLGLVLATPASRVVVVSSLAHHRARIHLDDLHWHRRRYRRWEAYATSKLANLLYVFELQRRFEAAGDDALAVAAHPGYTRTGLLAAGPTVGGGARAMLHGLVGGLGNHLVAQPPQAGVLPQLFAATAPDIAGSSYWGPSGVGEFRGEVAPARVSRPARDRELARALWELTEAQTGVRHAR